MDKIFYSLIVICFLFAGYLFLYQKPTHVNPKPATIVRSETDFKDRLLLGKGVQHYCINQFELASCLAYAIECGKDCDDLLPVKVRKKMFNEYNKYLIARGERPIQSPALDGSSVIGNSN